MDRTRRQAIGTLAGGAAGLLVGCTIREPAAAAPAVRPALVRRGADRGGGDRGWLRTRYTFSFADYRDPEWMGFRALRVINEDHIRAGHGFPLHPHRDMEILTYVLDGALRHEDTLGNGGVVRPGLVQWMSAGRGIRHSEVNPQPDRDTHLLQIWLYPDRKGYAPTYGQQSFTAAERGGRLKLLAAPGGAGGALPIRTDARLYATILGPGQAVAHRVAAGRHAWLHVARGRVRAAGLELAAGDAIAVSEAGRLPITAMAPSECLLFDLA